MSERVQVMVRLRPCNQQEEAHGGAGKVVECSGDEARFLGDGTTGWFRGTDTGQAKRFTYDRVFDPAASQEDLYRAVGGPTVANVLKGYNGSVLAYGQTGSGKTHSMMGPDGGNPEFLDPAHGRYADRGMVPRIAEELFAQLQQLDAKEVEWAVTAQCFELYKEQIHDLGVPASEQKEYRIREDTLAGRGVYVENLHDAPCADAAALLRVIRGASSQRMTAATGANDTSSRSHSVVVVTVNQVNHVLENRTRAHLHLVDLAGSEKVGKTGAQGDRLKEAQTINLSLTLLGNVIYKLTDGRSLHIPYRDSKLTRILQDSFGGNSRTTLLCNCSPHSYNAQETLGTLQFASRAKMIKNKPVCGKELSGDELRLAYARALEEIRALKDRVAMREVRPQPASPGACPTCADMRAKVAAQQEELREARDSLYEARALVEAHAKELAWYRKLTSEGEAREKELRERVKREAAASATWARRWHDRNNKELRATVSKPQPGDAPRAARRGSGPLGEKRPSIRSHSVPQGPAAKGMKGRDRAALAAKVAEAVAGPAADAAEEAAADAAAPRPRSGGESRPGSGPGSGAATPVDGELAALPPDPALLERIDALEEEVDKARRKGAAAERLYSEVLRGKVQLGMELEARSERIDELERQQQLAATKHTNLEREMREARDEAERMRREISQAELSREEKERLLGRKLLDSEAALTRLRDENSELGRVAARLRDAAAQREYCELVAVELAVKGEDVMAAENDAQMLEAWTVDQDVKEAIGTNALGTLGDVSRHFDNIRRTLAKEQFTAQETEAARRTLLREVTMVLDRAATLTARVHSMMVA